jgi:hypothetical protein
MKQTAEMKERSLMVLLFTWMFPGKSGHGLSDSVYLLILVR